MRVSSATWQIANTPALLAIQRDIQLEENKKDLDWLDLERER